MAPKGRGIGEKTVFAFAGMYNGVLTELRVFAKESEAAKAFRDYTGLSYRTFLRQTKPLDIKLEDSRIYALTME